MCELVYLDKLHENQILLVLENLLKNHVSEEKTFTTVLTSMKICV